MWAIISAIHRYINTQNGSTLFLSDELQEKLKTEMEAKNHIEKKYNSLKGMRDENSLILSVYLIHIVAMDLPWESIND